MKDGVASGVVLSNGDEIEARAVISNADPKRTLLGFVDPQHLAPSFLQRLQHYRMNGTVAKVNLALSGLPIFNGVNGNASTLLGGRIQVSPEVDYLERAFDASKYGEFSQHPYLEATIPTLHDASLAPAGKHVMSIYMQYAPYKLRNADWDTQRDALGDVVVNTLAQYAPDLPGRSKPVRSLRRKTWNRPTDSPAAKSSMANWRSTSCSPCVRYWIGRSTARPSRACIYAAPARIPAMDLTGGSGANAAREIAKDLRKR